MPQGNFQVVVHLLVGTPGIGNLDRVDIEDLIKLRSLKIFRHRGSGDQGVIIKVLADTVILAALIVQHIVIGAGIRLVIMKIRIDFIDFISDQTKGRYHKNSPSGQPCFCFHARFPSPQKLK